MYYDTYTSRVNAARTDFRPEFAAPTLSLSGYLRLAQVQARRKTVVLSARTCGSLSFVRRSQRWKTWRRFGRHSRRLRSDYHHHSACDIVSSGTIRRAGGDRRESPCAAVTRGVETEAREGGIPASSLSTTLRARTRRTLGAGMASCLRLDVGGLSKVLASLRARAPRRSSRGDASRRVASRRAAGFPRN